MPHDKSWNKHFAEKKEVAQKVARYKYLNAGTGRKLSPAESKEKTKNWPSVKEAEAKRKLFR